MSKHNWICISPGEYDSTYRCKKCLTFHTESIDDPHSKLPKRGCKNKPTKAMINKLWDEVYGINK